MSAVVGLDLGYYQTKLCQGESALLSWPSVVGSADLSRFRVTNTKEDVLVLPALADGSFPTYFFGESAVHKSRTLARREDRSWVDSNEYHLLFLSALSKCREQVLLLVTGLPIAYFDDAEKLRKKLTGGHVVNHREYHVDETVVMQQPFGTVLDQVFAWDGSVANVDLAIGRVGVVDIGGKTTNLLRVDELDEIARDTTSVNVGGWDILRAVQVELNRLHPEAELRDHDLMQALISGKLQLWGETLDISRLVQESIAPLAAQVVAQATQMWGSGAELERILVTGGGAAWLAPALLSAFRNATLVEAPAFANVRGFFKYGRFLERK